MSLSRAHTGAESVQNSADSEKMPAIRGSAMPTCRPMAGSTDCSPVLPAAVARLTAKMITKARRDSRPGAEAGAGESTDMNADHTDRGRAGEGNRRSRSPLDAGPA